jgi:hypothetical protein
LCQKYGPIIERHALFPEKTNVEFAQVIDDNTIRSVILAYEPLSLLKDLVKIKCAYIECAKFTLVLRLKVNKNNSKGLYVLFS